MFEIFDNPVTILIFILIFSILFLLIIGLSFRQKTEEIFVTDKEKFLKKINLCLFQMGYNLESNRDNFITYKRSFVRVAITFNHNKAMIIGPIQIVNRLLKLYMEKKA